MNKKDAQVIQSITDGKPNNKEEIRILIENDREQLIDHLKEANPVVYSANESIFEEAESDQLAKFIVTEMRAKRLIFPPMKWAVNLAAPNAELFQRLKDVMVYKKMKTSKG